MEVVSERAIKLRVFERGVGETLACGTGACAAVAYGISRGWLRDFSDSRAAGGKLFDILGRQRPARDHDRTHCGGVPKAA